MLDDCMEKWKHFDDCPRISDRNYRWLGLIALLSRTGGGSQKWGEELILKGNLRNKVIAYKGQLISKANFEVFIWTKNEGKQIIILDDKQSLISMLISQYFYIWRILKAWAEIQKIFSFNFWFK